MSKVIRATGTDANFSRMRLWDSQGQGSRKNEGSKERDRSGRELPFSTEGVGMRGHDAENVVAPLRSRSCLFFTWVMGLCRKTLNGSSRKSMLGAAARDNSR